jgi:heptosyltransferase-2
MAPGSIWETKKWPEEYYHKLCELLRKRKSPPIILVGSERERLLCQRIAVGLEDFVFNATGEFTPIECASLLKRAKCLITNDSAAGHLAAAMGTRVISIFGPTTPDFGFAPYGKDHIIIEHPNLYCRPCRIHGSKRCPEKHFRCMRELTPDQVLEKVCKAFI